MKKIFITSLLAVTAATAANANGFYVTPKVGYSRLNIKESRVEKKWDGSEWAVFAGNKHESWSEAKHQFVPKIAFGYDFATDDYGIFSVETEYAKTDNQFKAMNSKYDFNGATPNDSDMRTYQFTESTLSLNAKYGYNLKFSENISVTPFATAGIGYSVIDSESNFRSGRYWWDTKDQEENLSWNVGAGFEIPFSEKIAFTAEYKYTDLGEVKYSNWMYEEKGTANGIERHFDSKSDLQKHEVSVGIKVML